MIPVTELRIGNWVLVDGAPDTVLAIRFYDSSMQPYRVEVERTRSRLAKELHSISPIPLTPEILEKCGFKFRASDYDWFHWHIGTNPITQDWLFDLKELRGRMFFYRNAAHIINYLHQLQNLYFALTSTELEIKM